MRRRITTGFFFGFLAVALFGCNPDAEIKAFTNETLTALTSHLEVIKGTQSKMK